MRNTLETDKEYTAWVLNKQNAFRKAALKFWGGRCCVTGVDVTEVLVAAHIRLWAKCDASQRMNPYDSLLLSLTYDKLFGKFLIIFHLEVNGTALMAYASEVEATADRFGIH